MVMASRQFAIDHFDRSNFDQAMPHGRVQPRGFGVEKNLSHCHTLLIAKTPALAS